LEVDTRWFEVNSDLWISKFRSDDLGFGDWNLQSITFETLKIQAGQDAGGVGTDMITMNATLRMLYRNTGTFFGVHVTSTPIDLSFSQIKIGSGSVSLPIQKLYRMREEIDTNMNLESWDWIGFDFVCLFVWLWNAG